MWRKKIFELLGTGQFDPVKKKRYKDEILPSITDESEDLNEPKVSMDPLLKDLAPGESYLLRELRRF